MQFEVFFIYLGLAIVGLCMGSFAGASVWRLRARQLRDDKAHDEPVDDSEYNKLSKLVGHKVSNDHSICLHCGYSLKWYDLVPLLSWILLKGRCRKCHKTIGYAEPLIELGVALFFVLSYALWPYQLTNSLEIARLAVWLLAGVGLSMLFVYDMKWSLLPDVVSYSVVALGLLNVIISAMVSNDVGGLLTSVVGSVAILSGIYLAIYILSQGMWIGFGDIKLGLGLALLLADWRLAFIALFSANLVGSLIVVPPMLMGKLKRDSRVPFGPLLIVGFVIAGLAGTYLLDLFLLTISYS